MGRFILKRLLISLPILLVITILIFTLLQFTPGDPINAFLPPDQSMFPEQKDALRRQLGLDQPAPSPFFFWLNNPLQGKFWLPLQKFRAGKFGYSEPRRPDRPTDGDRPGDRGSPG